MRAVSPVMPGFDVDEVIWAPCDLNNSDVEPLPAVLVNEGKTSLTRWELSDEDRHRIAEGQAIYLWIATGDEPLQPVMMGVFRPEELMVTDETEAEEKEEDWPDIVGK